jgi:hypothetical protein
MLKIDGKSYVTVAEACKRLKLDPYPIAAALVQGPNAGDRARDLDLGPGFPRLRIERHLGILLVPVWSIQAVGQRLKKHRQPLWRLITMYEERAKWQSNPQARDRTETRMLDMVWQLSPSSTGHPRQPV